MFKNIKTISFNKNKSLLRNIVAFILTAIFCLSSLFLFSACNEKEPDTVFHVGFLSLGNGFYNGSKYFDDIVNSSNQILSTIADTYGVPNNFDSKDLFNRERNAENDKNLHYYIYDLIVRSKKAFIGNKNGVPYLAVSARDTFNIDDFITVSSGAVQANTKLTSLEDDTTIDKNANLSLNTAYRVYDKALAIDNYEFIFLGPTIGRKVSTTSRKYNIETKDGAIDYLKALADNHYYYINKKISETALEKSKNSIHTDVITLEKISWIHTFEPQYYKDREKALSKFKAEYVDLFTLKLATLMTRVLLIGGEEDSARIKEALDAKDINLYPLYLDSTRHEQFVRMAGRILGSGTFTYEHVDSLCKIFVNEFIGKDKIEIHHKNEVNLKIRDIFLTYCRNNEESDGTVDKTGRGIDSIKDVGNYKIKWYDVVSRAEYFYKPNNETSDESLEGNQTEDYASDDYIFNGKLSSIIVKGYSGASNISMVAIEFEATNPEDLFNNYTFAIRESHCIRDENQPDLPDTLPPGTPRPQVQTKLLPTKTRILTDRDVSMSDLKSGLFYVEFDDTIELPASSFSPVATEFVGHCADNKLLPGRGVYYYGNSPVRNAKLSKHQLSVEHFIEIIWAPKDISQFQQIKVLDVIV